MQILQQIEPCSCLLIDLLLLKKAQDRGLLIGLLLSTLKGLMLLIYSLKDRVRQHTELGAFNEGVTFIS